MNLMAIINKEIQVLALKGDTGATGYSPIASVSKNGDTATITITDKTGTTRTTITDGYDPTITTSRSGKVTTLTITDAEGTQTAAINDGYDPTATVTKSGHTATIAITDVQGTTRATITEPTASVSKSGSISTITITDVNGTTTATVADGAGSWGEIDGDITAQTDLMAQFDHVNEQVSNCWLYAKTITLTTSNWVSSGSGYYYQITDSSVYDYYLINGNMDLDNQAKLKDGYIQSYDGYYRIYTSELPTENISMTITKQYTQSW